MLFLQLEKFVENFDSKNLGIPWNVFVKLMKKNKYKSLLKICKLIVKIKYSYKEQEHRDEEENLCYYSPCYSKLWFFFANICHTGDI